MSLADERKQRRTLLTRWVTLFLIAAAIVMALGTSFFENNNAQAVFEQNNTRLFDAPRSMNDVSLIQHNGKPFSVTLFKGQWNVVNFGYSHCPDICPTNMADMNLAAKALGDVPVQFWMVTVDPARDTAEHLAQYVPYFNEGFIGVTGTVKDIGSLAMQLSAVFYQDSEGEYYTVAHSDTYALINPQGEFVGLINPPHRPEHIVNTLNQLMKTPT